MGQLGDFQPQPPVTPPDKMPPTTMKSKSEIKRKHWDTPARTKVLTLKDEGYSDRAIEEQTGVPKSTVARICKNRKERRNKLRTGRPPKLTKHDTRRILAIATKNWNGRKLSFHQLAKEAGIAASGKTVKRALRKLGYRRCRACRKPFICVDNQKKRRAYAWEHANRDMTYWRPHMYSDECSFDTSKRGTIFVTRCGSERYHTDCMHRSFHSGRGSFMVWGAISYNWKSPLIFLEGTGKRGVCADDYLEQVLDPFVGPAFCGCFGYTGYREGGEFVEDQAGVHGTRKKFVEVKAIMGILLHRRPASSPDLNPIENVWRILKQRIKARRHFPGTLAKLRVAVQEEWDKLKPEDWNKYIDSMPERLREVRQRKGLQTQY
jgi:transposase